MRYAINLLISSKDDGVMTIQFGHPVCVERSVRGGKLERSQDQDRREVRKQTSKPVAAPKSFVTSHDGSNSSNLLGLTKTHHTTDHHQKARCSFFLRVATFPVIVLAYRKFSFLQIRFHDGSRCKSLALFLMFPSPWHGCICLAVRIENAD